MGKPKAEPHPTQVKFPLADDGDKWFLSHVFLEREFEGSIAIGVSKENGDCYAFTRITEEQLFAALTVLGITE